MANIFVSALGSSTLGLSYGLVAAEALIAPAMPSTTARAGGVFLPIISSLSKQAGSLPGATAGKVSALSSGAAGPALLGVTRCYSGSSASGPRVQLGTRYVTLRRARSTRILPSIVRQVGAFLVQSQLQSSGHSSAMYMTGAAQNLLSLKLAAEVTGVPLNNPWRAAHIRCAPPTRPEFPEA